MFKRLSLVKAGRAVIENLRRQLMVRQRVIEQLESRLLRTNTIDATDGNDTISIFGAASDFVAGRGFLTVEARSDNDSISQLSIRDTRLPCTLISAVSAKALDAFQ